jgi:hypothetical protein
MSEVTNVGEQGEQLVGLLEEQRNCYEQLKRLAERQRRLIADQDAESLLKILAERQRLVDRLGELNKALQPYRQEWADTYAQLAPQRREHVRQLLDEINVLLGSILIADAEDSRLLAAKKSNVADRLKQTASAKTANAAYASRAYQTAGAGVTDREA